MKVVIDTNILLVSISKKSPLHWVFKGFLDEEYVLCVTTDILMEYEEIITQHMGYKVADNTLRTIRDAWNTHFITRYYQWNLVEVDYDDNKFVDCAIAANANYLISQDRHFRVLKQVEFPKVELLNVEEFGRKMAAR